MYNIHHFHEALRIFQRKRVVAKHGIKKYSGDAKTICKTIVDDCWNGDFFQASTGHFSLFYMRDFGICIKALLKLGYKKEVEKTLQFALAVYSRENRLSTTISTSGKGFDVFHYAPDTLAFLLYSLRISKATELVEIYRPFLEQQIQYFYRTVIDDNTGLVRCDKIFSTIKDNAKRRSCCYDNVCAAVVAGEAEKLKLINPLKQYDYQKLLKETFWTGSYFKDTADTDYICGDANTFPYWFSIFTDKKMINHSIKKIQEENLDKPFPLKYTTFTPNNFFFPLSILVPNYEGTSIWMHLGLCYIDIADSFDKRLAKEYIKKYKEIIEKHRNFLELFDEAGNPYKTLFYYSDQGMLWASKLLVYL